MHLSSIAVVYKLETIESLPSATYAYLSTGEQSYSCEYNTQVSLQPAARSQNTRWSACWSDRTRKQLAVATSGCYSCGCNTFAPQQNSKYGLLEGGRLWTLDPIRRLELGDHCLNHSNFLPHLLVHLLFAVLAKSSKLWVP